MSTFRNSGLGSTAVDSPLLDEAFEEGVAASGAPENQGNILRRLASRIGATFMLAKVDLISVLFILSGVLSGLVLRVRMSDDALYYKAFLSDLAVYSLLSAVGLLIRRTRRPVYYATVTVLFCVLLVFDTIYFRSHMSVLSLFLLHQLQFLPEVSDAAVSLVGWSDFIYPLIAFGFIGAMLFLKRRGYFAPSTEGPRCRKCKLATFLLVFAIIFGLFATFMTNTESSRITKQWNRPYLVEHFGVYTFHLSDFIKFVGSSHGLSDIDQKSYERVVDFYEGLGSEPHQPNDYTGLLEGQNLIVIHAESVQGMFMHKTVGGVELTPNMSRLASEGFYFSDFHAQQSAGTSSDSEFTFNTSLYPIHDGTVFISHFNNTFNSIPKMLGDKGYTAVAMHGNHRAFWNREVMNKNLGYDRFYGKRDFEQDDIVGMGVSDKSFFRQGAEIISSLEQPFMATMITLTNHTPFADEDKYGELDVGEFEGRRFGRYLKSLRYADEAVGQFVDDLDRRGLLDNTTILIYGDHPANLDRESTAEFLGREDFDGYDHRRAKSVPLIIWSKRIEKPEVVEQPMGMLDVGPTLGNLMGFENPYALGKDIFSGVENIVAFPDGSWIDSDILYSSASMSYKVYGPELRAKAVGEACGVTPLEVSEIEEGDCDYNGLRGVFHLQGAEASAEGEVAEMLRERVLATNARIAREVEVSDLILEYDLLASPDEEHRHSIVTALK